MYYCLLVFKENRRSFQELFKATKKDYCFNLFQIQHMYRCARVQGLDTGEGLLLFGKEHFYVVDGFTLTANREIRDIETLPVK